MEHLVGHCTPRIIRPVGERLLLAEDVKDSVITPVTLITLLRHPTTILWRIGAICVNSVDSQAVPVPGPTRPRTKTRVVPPPLIDLDTTTAVYVVAVVLLVVAPLKDS